MRLFLAVCTYASYSRNPGTRSPSPDGVKVNPHHTCSSAVGGYCPGFRDGLSVATGAPFDGTSEAIPAAAETGFEAGVLRDSSVPAALAVLVFTNELVPVCMFDIRANEGHMRTTNLKRRQVPDTLYCQ